MPAEESEPCVDDVLEQCVVYTMDDDGNFILDEEESRGRDQDKWQLDASRLVQTDDSAQLDKLIKHLQENAKHIYGIRINGAKLNVDGANRLCETLWNRGLFPKLIDCDYAYMRMSFASIALMSDTLNPALKGGYCPIKRLVLTRMELSYRGSEQLFNALCGNIFVEELIVNGNGCTDAALPALARTMRNSQNRFRLLGLGGNELTAEGMHTLAPVLEQHPYLAELELQGNTSLGDEGSDVLFKAIRDNTSLETLNLSNCELQEIPWAGRLRIMTALSTLNLSQNRINDKGCQVLASALESCFCLRYLDVSHNLFGGRLSTGLGEAVKLNKGLLALNLSSNPMIFEVWNAITYGLMENRTLMKLDLTWCDLDLKCAGKLMEALAVNEICDVVMDLNPLPDVLRMTPRLYRREGWPVAKAIDPKAPGIALEAGQEWRSAKLSEIQLSKDALEVVKRASAAGGGDEEDLKSMAGDSSVAAMSISASVYVSPGAHRAKMLASTIAVADEQAETGFGGKMVVTICYGRPSEILGTVEVSHFTTYAMARDIVRPLVERYLAALGNLSLAGTLIENFSVLDPSGQPVLGNESFVRTIWAEAAVNDFVVLLRPGNWISLEESSGVDEEDDELDYDFGGEDIMPVQTEFDSLRKNSSGPWYKEKISGDGLKPSS